jgi:RNase H-fold protein (predicted Holliday junction resolvase)
MEAHGSREPQSGEQVPRRHGRSRDQRQERNEREQAERDNGDSAGQQVETQDARRADQKTDQSAKTTMLQDWQNEINHDTFPSRPAAVC